MKSSLTHQNLILDSFIISSNIFMETVFWLAAQGQTWPLLLIHFHFTIFFKIISLKYQNPEDEEGRGSSQGDSSLPVDPVRDNFDKYKNFVNPKISKFIPIWLIYI